jgi:hypothetical protein
MAKLKLIDSDLLLDIIRASRPQPPSNQDLVLSSEADRNIDTLLKQPPSQDNTAKINTQLNNQTTFLDKFYHKHSPSTSPTPKIIAPHTSQTPHTDSSETQDRQYSDNNTVLTHFGKLERKRVTPILDRLRSNNSKLTWDENFQIVENGIPIPGSNIHDLIKAVTGKAKRIRSTPGLTTFIRHLKTLNVPLYSAGTDKARRYLQSGKVDSALDPLLTTKVTSQKRSHTPQTPPRKRQRTRSQIGSGIITNWI